MVAKLIHAVQYKSYGGGPSGLKHVEIPIPTPKKDDVLLKVEAASLNPGDFKIQKGMARPFLPSKLPHTPVTDVAGEIVEVGQGVQKFKVGDEVVALLTYSNGGGLAEFAAAKEKSVVSRPPEVSAAEGAGLPVAGLSAHQALTKAAGIKLDGTGQLKNILITGAAGGVGADEVLDYKTTEGEALKSPLGRKYDFVIHSASAAIPWSVFEPNLSARGKVIDLTPGASSLFTFLLKKITFSKKRLVPLMINAKAENLDCLVQLVKEGKLKTVIDSNHSLSKAEDAWAKRINSQCTGKIIVEP
ncbi:hypothetical protein L3X38_044615 [Prunus dulcis]|uniref:Enoyl reductase (ER) domain-containing protein n=1 Tax=Prunus dulcis TaxID=3755 RepID=A0AAD4V0B1_PRUDU|nr:hypothetical protein L3X38_044615 [Prunus dulcis]